MRISDWSSDVCSSDLFAGEEQEASPFGRDGGDRRRGALEPRLPRYGVDERAREKPGAAAARRAVGPVDGHEQLSGTLTGVEGDAVEAVADRTSVVEGKSVSVRVDLGGRSITNNNKTKL